MRKFEAGRRGRLAPHVALCFSEFVGQITTSNFGLVIAYLLPGFVALWGIAVFSETVRSWLGTPPVLTPTVGGFLYVTLASVGAGLTVSTIRWMVVDAIHHRTGVQRPKWNFSQLEQNVTAFGTLIEIHYRYYQFYANMLVALAALFAARRFATPDWPTPLDWLDGGLLVLSAVFFAGSRDTLHKYYSRVAELLGERERPEISRRQTWEREFIQAPPA